MPLMLLCVCLWRAATACRRAYLAEYRRARDDGVRRRAYLNLELCGALRLDARAAIGYFVPKSLAGGARMLLRSKRASLCRLALLASVLQTASSFFSAARCPP